MTKSILGDFIFIAFILVCTQLVSNYAFEDEPLTLARLFTIKKIISLLVGIIAGTFVMYLVKRSRFLKSIDKK